MSRRVIYEWDHEVWDTDDDVVDHDFSEEYPGLPTEPDTFLVLVRNEYESDGNLYDRTWAYAKCGELPERFEDGTPVPQRFHKELAR